MTILDDLKQAVAGKRAMIIAGAGTTIAAVGRDVECATWTGLIENGLRRAADLGGWKPDTLSLYLTMARSDDLDALLAAAQKIAGALGQEKGDGAFSGWLRGTVGSLAVKDKAILDAMAALHRHGLLLATTNYDSLLSNACNVPPVIVSEEGDALRLLRKEDKGILHLHGHHKTPRSVVLGTALYKNVVDDPFQTFLQQALAAGNSLIFVGCGGTMDDPNIARLLEWLDGTLRGAEHFHYFLCLESDLPKWRAKGWKKLKPLSFGPSHTDLSAFLNSLLPTAPTKSSPPPVPLAAAPLVPPPPAHFVGRKTEMDTAIKALLSGQHVCVMGTGGIGKTGLTKRIAHDPGIAAAYPRRLFVRLEGATTGHDAALKVAEALGMPPSPHILGPLVHALAQQPTLLILDNAETPRDGDTTGTEDFLSQVGQAAKILLSIRSHQSPKGLEWVRVPLSQLGDDDTRRLFLGIAGDHLSTDPHLPNLLAKTDGIPLAIRLLAAQAEGQNNLRDLWTEWQNIRARLLETDGRADKDGNFTASVMLSLNSPKLTKEGKRLLSLLGQLPDGLAPAMRDELLGTTGPAAQRNLLHLALAQLEKERLRLLVPVREVVNIKRRPTAQDNLKLVEIVVRIANEVKCIGSESSLDSVENFRSNFGNIICILSNNLNNNNNFNLLNSISAVARYQLFSGFYRVDIIIDSIKILIERGFKSTAVEQILYLGDIYLLRHSYAEALFRYEQALDFSKSLKSDLGQGNCLGSLGKLMLAMGRCIDAERYAQEAIKFFELSNDLQGIANCKNLLGDISIKYNDFESAHNYYKSSMVIYKNINSELGEANCIQSLGDIAIRCSEYDSARNYFCMALEKYKNLGDRLGEANCVKGVADVELRSGNYQDAYKNFEEALYIFEQIGDSLGVANSLRALGLNSALLGHNRVAVDLYENAITHYMRLNRIYDVGETFRRLAQVAETDADRLDYIARARAAWSTMGEDGQRLIQEHLDALT